MADEYPTESVYGRMWFYDEDKHAYLETDDPMWGGGPLPIKMLLAGDPPTEHGNEVHTTAFLSEFAMVSDPNAFFTVSDLTISSGAAATIRSVGQTAGYWELPSAGFNFRPDAGNSGDVILDVWWESPSGTQKSAKVPITVKLGEGKRPFFIGVPFRDSADISFWSLKAGSARTLYLRGQTRSESVIVSDRYLSALRTK